MVTWTVYFSESASLVTVVHKSELVGRHLEDRSKPKQRTNATEYMCKRRAVAWDHAHFGMQHLKIRGIQGDEIFIAETFFEVGVSGGQVGVTDLCLM